MEYQYHNYEFTRKALDPITEDEHKLLLQDYQNFIDSEIARFQSSTKQKPNPHGFNWKRFKTFLIVFLILFSISITAMLLGNQTVEGIFGILCFFPFLGIIFQPFLYLLSGVKSTSSAVSFQEEMKMYYEFHYYKMKKTNSYKEYVESLTYVTEDDYIRFSVSGITGLR